MKHIYMVGIGGIGMSALAQLYHARGISVSGSDREASPTIDLLQEKGIGVFIGEDTSHVPEHVDMLVYSDAVLPEHSERVHVRERGVKEQSYFEALGEATHNRFTIAVAGSHGKTTTTAMIAKVLFDGELSPTAIVGSLVKDFDSNFLDGGSEGPFVVEACEYRDHMLKLSPTILVITNLEWDHTDYFKTFEQLKKSFIQAVEKLPENGTLIIDTTTTIGKELASHAPCTVVNYKELSSPELRLLGEFNKDNARAAKAAVRAYAPDVSEETIDRALSDFHGSWRRFEYKGVAPHGSDVYDDYAHHPTEIERTLEEVKKKFPDKYIVVAFHPHLYSRTRDFMDEFSHAFINADEVLLIPIYPAREEPIEGVTSEVLAERIVSNGTKAYAVKDFNEAEKRFREYDGVGTILITMGAGDIYKVADTVVQSA